MDLPDMGEILERCSEPGGSYLPLNQPGLSGLVLRNWAIADHDPSPILKKIESPAAERCKASAKVTAVLVDDIFVKRYNILGWGNAFRKLFKMPRPERVLAGAIRLREFEIPTPEVLAALRATRFRLPSADYLLTRKLSTQCLLLDQLSSEFAQGDPYRQFVSGVTSLLVKMHAAGVEHGDLNLRNMFCRKSPIGVYSDWGVIDLDGCRIYSEEMPEPRRKRELARVVSSFLRYAKLRAPQVKLDFDAVITDFTRKYKELSGYNLAGSALDARIAYLANRVRKDKA